MAHRDRRGGDDRQSDGRTGLTGAVQPVRWLQSEYPHRDRRGRRRAERFAPRRTRRHRSQPRERFTDGAPRRGDGGPCRAHGRGGRVGRRGCRARHPLPTPDPTARGGPALRGGDPRALLRRRLTGGGQRLLRGAPRRGAYRDRRAGGAPRVIRGDLPAPRVRRRRPRGSDRSLGLSDGYGRAGEARPPRDARRRAVANRRPRNAVHGGCRGRGLRPHVSVPALLGDVRSAALRGERRAGGPPGARRRRAASVSADGDGALRGDHPVQRRGRCHGQRAGTPRRLRTRAPRRSAGPRPRRR